MSTVDLAMDMENLGRVLTGMKVPKDIHFSYPQALAYLEEHCATHPDYEVAKKLIKDVQSRLNQAR
jgi:ATP sulfurylase